jgi:hypothetical protein
MEEEWAQLIEEMTAKGSEALDLLTSRYTPQTVSGMLDTLASSLALYLVAVRKDNEDPQHVAGRGLVIYMTTLWERLREWERLPCDLLAWTTRNLMEVHFWTQFIIGSRDSAASFLREREIDQRELWKLYLNTKEPEDFHDVSLCAIKVLAESISGKRVHVKNEDDFLFKKCSKYIHPSAWLIADCERRMNDRFARYQFVAFSLHYLSEITSLLLESHPQTQFLVANSGCDTKLQPGAAWPTAPIKRIPISDLHSEDGAHELATSPEMEPYLKFAMAVMKGSDPTAELEALRQLPLEKRYVWRVASALKWAFGDCDDLSVGADKQTLTPEDFAKVMELLKFRPMQFCIFLKALVGAQEMQRMMVQAIGVADKS